MENNPNGRNEIALRPSAGVETRPASYSVQGESYPHAAPEIEHGGGLMAYWLSLRRHKGALVLFTICGLIVAVVYTLRQTPVYEARTSIEVQDMNMDFLGGRPVNPVGDDANYGALADIPTQIRLLQSESLAARALEKVSASGGAVIPPPRNAFAAWRSLLHLGGARSAGTLVNPRSALSGVRVRASGQTRVIEVLVDSTSPSLAAEYANTLASEFIDSNVEARWKMSQRTGEWLQRQLEDMRIKLERSEDALQGYARRANLMFTSSSDDKTSVSEERLGQLQESLTTAQTERVAAQSRYEMVNSSSPGALSEVIGDDSLREMEGQLNELRKTEAELLTTYTPKHEKVVKVRAQMGAIQVALEKQKAASLERLRGEFETAQHKEKLLAAEYAKQSQLVSGEAERSIQYGILKREVDSNRQLYDAMLQKVKETSVTSAMRASNIRVVDPASVPGMPYKPDLSQNAGIGILGGLLLGVSFVLMRERSDHTIQEPGDAQFWLNVPELGVIPKGSLTLKFYYGKRKVALESGSERNEHRVGIRKRSELIELITWENKPSVQAESFRAALVSILFSGQNGNRPRVMVVTSSGPAEGKSTVVSNLGIAVAEVNQKVLLIDADLRKPRLNYIFGLKGDRGLGDVLRSKEPLAAALDGVIQETDIPGLYILPSGPSTAAATSLLYSNRMPDLVALLRTQFDTIFIDTPPMLQIPDARVLGRMVDSAILVIRSGKTTRDAAMAARQRLSEDGTPVLGTLLNDWNPKWSPSGYYGYDGGYYSGYYGGGGYGGHGSKPKSKSDNLSLNGADRG